VRLISFGRYFQSRLRAAWLLARSGFQMLDVVSHDGKQDLLVLPFLAENNETDVPPGRNLSVFLGPSGGFVFRIRGGKEAR
jgi:hypothetical protein